MAVADGLSEGMAVADGLSDGLARAGADRDDAGPGGGLAGGGRGFRPGRAAVAAWIAVWPKLAAVAVGLALWQAVVWTGWKPSYLLPGPFTVLNTLRRNLLGGSPVSGHLLAATVTTLQRAVAGYGVALVLGTAIGVAVARSRILRTAVGSMITGFQTMPSVAWLPLAVVLFQTSERAILFVLLIGAVPSIANGVIAGIDTIPPLLLRAGRVLGARGWARYRYVVLPAALPGFVAGMKQAWAFAWRSLLAGELIVQIAHRPSLGQTLDNAANQNDYAGLMAGMVLLLVVGLLLDALVFGKLEQTVLRRRGLGSRDATGGT